MVQDANATAGCAFTPLPHPGDLIGMSEPCGALPRKCLFVHYPFSQNPRMGRNSDSLWSQPQTQKRTARVANILAKKKKRLGLCSPREVRFARTSATDSKTRNFEIRAEASDVMRLVMPITVKPVR
jgi:hypothetical protein